MDIFTKQTESGRWLGWPQGREDVIASGETKEECEENVRTLYTSAINHEAQTPS